MYTNKSTRKYTDIALEILILEFLFPQIIILCPNICWIIYHFWCLFSISSLTLLTVNAESNPIDAVYTQVLYTNV
jgi:hypothetical protein